MELKLSDEQYEKIGNIGYKAYFSHQPMSDTKGRVTSAGRAAVDAVLAEVLPVVLAEPSAEELNESGYGSRTQWYVRDHQRARRLFTNRLARFTAPKDAPKDAAKEAVQKIVLLDGDHLSDEEAEAVVAAIRAADREAGR